MDETKKVVTLKGNQPEHVWRMGQNQFKIRPGDKGWLMEISGVMAKVSWFKCNDPDFYALIPMDKLEILY